MPSQLKQRVPWFSFCQDFFTAYDPPHALVTATAFVPPPTPGRNAKAQPPTPAPSATLDPGARKTTAGVGPVPPLTNTPAVERPKATIDPIPLSKLGSPNSGPSDPKKESDGKTAGDPKHGSNSKQSSGTSDNASQGDKSEDNSDPKQSSGKNGDPSQGDRSEEGNDPEQGSGNSSDSSRGNKSEEGNDPKQGSGSSDDFSQGDNTKGSSDPKKDSGTGRDPSQSSGTSEDPRPKIDWNVPGLPLESTVAVNGDQDISRLAGSIVPDEAKHNDNNNAVGGESDPGSLGSSTNHVFNTLIPHGTEKLVIGSPTDSSTSPKLKSIVTTIAGQAITAAPTAITIPGTILKQGGPGVTLHGTLVALDTGGQLVVDSKTIPIPAGTNSEPFATTIGGQVIAATSDAIAVAGTTLGPGDAGVSVNGTLLSLDTAGHFVVGSKTQTLESEIVGLAAAISEPSGSAGPFGPAVTTPMGGNAANETEKRNSTGTGVQAFEGKAEDLISGLRMKKIIAVFVAVILAIFV